MPCLNEEEALPFCLDKAFSFLKNNQIKGEVLVVDNGSSDNSACIASDKGCVLIKEHNRGYGSAIMTGIRQARGKYIIIGDADDSYDFSDLMKFLTSLRSGIDVVIGNRFSGGIQKKAMQPLHRYLGNPVLSFLGRVFFRVPIKDFHCGLRGIRRDIFEQLDLRTTGMEFASEMIVKAALNNLAIAEVPTILYQDKRKRRSHLKTWRDGWRHLRFLLLYSPKWLFYFPGIALIALGALGTILLAVGPVEIGNKTLDVHTLVYTSALILLGFQFISCYFFSRVYAATNGLLPGQKSFLERFNKSFSLEVGIFGGLILLTAGFYFMAKSFSYWRHTHFGNIDPVIVLRWVVPSALLIVLGVQIVITSFYLSFLTIKSKQ
jgi:glycosyltransferase involved in cell wall biosynthesis